MTENQLTVIVTEIKGEMQLSPSVPNTNLAQFAKEGEAFLNSRVEFLVIDFDVDLNARSLLKNYIRYAYYGSLNEFKNLYQGDIYDMQIRYID